MDFAKPQSKVYLPSKNFSQTAHIRSMEQYEELWKKAKNEPETFWGEVSKDFLTWHKPWNKVLHWKVPNATWFEGGFLNVSENCVDRHAQGKNKNKLALIWEGELARKGDTIRKAEHVRTFTYAQLHEEVQRFANVLKKLGVKKSDTVAIYLPLIPEMMIAMLACARIGAIHTVVFGGFSAEALASRIQDAKAKVLISTEGGYRRGNWIDMKKSADAAVAQSPEVEHVLMIELKSKSHDLQRNYAELRAGASSVCVPEYVESSHPLFILYTSGSTGKPKGIQHSTAGYLVNAAYTHKLVFDLKPDDIYWCTADTGWITGHSYLVYGPLANAATVFMYEGAPDFPDFGRFWEMIDDHKISIFYTAPTAIRNFMKAGNAWVEKFNLSSLRLLGSVGEPINSEAWSWYYDKIGKNKCPIVDTWWQTETGSIMISPLPGCTPMKPGCATRPLPGVFAEVVNEKSLPVNPGEQGHLVVSQPWPGMLQTVFGDHDRYVNQYWSTHPGKYFTGDAALLDVDKNIWILGRVDDVINVSGHRLSTMEIESALATHPAVAESAVVGKPHDIKGEGICCFVTVKTNMTADDALKTKLIAHVAQAIGKFAKPDEIRFLDQLPKTRSGKIMRRFLRDSARGVTPNGDTSTIENSDVLTKL